MPTWDIGDTGNASNNVDGDLANFGTIASALADAGVTNGDTLRIVRINAEVSGGSAITISKSVTITAHDDAKVNAPTYGAMTGRARLDMGANALTINTTGIVIERVGIYGSAAVIVANYTATFKRCVFRTSGDTSVLMDGEGCTLLNVAVLRSGSRAFRVFGGTMYGYHISVNSIDTAFRELGGAIQSFACVVNGTGGSWDGTFTGSDENVSQDSYAPGTTNWRSQTGVFANTSSGFEDLSLSAGAQGDYGVSDYSGTHGDLATDIAGTTRTGTIDAGVWQTPAAAATSFVPRTRPAHFVHLRR